MTCGKCGYENHRKEKFCSECGYPLTEDIQSFIKESSFEEVNADNFSDRQIIRSLYGSRYIVKKVVYYVFSVPIVLLIILFFILLFIPNESDPNTPISISEVICNNALVKTTVKAIGFTEDDEYLSTYCEALVDDGKMCFLKIEHEDLDNILNSLPDLNDIGSEIPETGIEITGRSDYIGTDFIDSCIKNGYCESSEVFKDVYVKYMIEVNKKPVTNFSVAISYLAFFLLCPGLILFFIRLVAFKKYRNLERSLKALRNTGNVNSIDSLLKNAPYKPKTYRVEADNGVVFYPCNGKIEV